MARTMALQTSRSTAGAPALLCKTLKPTPFQSSSKDSCERPSTSGRFAFRPRPSSASTAARFCARRDFRRGRSRICAWRFPPIGRRASCLGRRAQTGGAMLNPFTQEHDAFRRTVRTFAEKELAPHALEWDRAGIFPKEIFKKCGELGFFGINFDPKWGGSGLDYWYVAAFCEELSYSRNAGVN